MRAAAALAGALLELSPAAVVGVDRRGRVVLFSPAAERLLGWEASEILGHSVRELYVNPDEPQRVWAQLQARSPTLPAAEDPLNLSLRHRNGERVPVQLVVVALRDELGEPDGTLGACVDLREAQAQGRRLEGALEQVEASEQRLRVLGRLQRALQDAAQPLTALSLELQLLHEMAPPEFKDRVNKSLIRMDALVKSLGAIAMLLNTPPNLLTSGLKQQRS